MNQLTSFQRKIAYLIGVVLLLIPIIVLGKPASRSEDGELTAGGTLAGMRQKYQLGEASLGNVDPSSSTMNLVLLGFRGVATNLLWQEAIEQREQKQWAGLRSTVNSIIMLQPYYIKVWDFQGWNLAYNVSAEWDNVPDRWYWVKEGGKFYMEGTQRNNKNAKLTHKTASVLGKKVGRSDERQFFRDYFLDDPNDELFGDGPDPEFNRGYNEPGPFSDNYLAARNWYLEANHRQESYPQGSLGMQLELFWSYPAHSYLSMASALQREGQFNETARRAWRDGYNAWINEFGGHVFPSRIGNYHLEVTSDSEFARMAERNSEELGQEITPAMVRELVIRRQNTTNYRYWRTRSDVERQPKTSQAHRDIYEGQRLYREGDLTTAREKILSGLEGLETIFANYSNFEKDELIVEEILMAMLYLRSANMLTNAEGPPLPEDTPHYELWQAIEGTPTLEDLKRTFQRETGLTGTE